MTEIYSINLVDEIVIITFNNKPDLQDIKSAVDTIKENYSDNKRLWDLTNSKVDFSREQIMELAEYSKSNLPQSIRAAIVANDDLGFGISREYEVYREEADEPLETRVFRKYDEAFNWLK